MNNLYTTEQLLLFYYGECDILESLEIENSLENCIGLNLKYSELVEQMQSLEEVKVSPKKSSIDRILAYAS